MVKVKFLKGKYGFEEAVIGEHAGHPLICAGISALGMTLIGALESVEGIQFEHLYTENGLISLRIHPFTDKKMQSLVDVIFQTIHLGIMQLANSYPENVIVTLEQV